MKNLIKGAICLIGDLLVLVSVVSFIQRIVQCLQWGEGAGIVLGIMCAVAIQFYMNKRHHLRSFK